MFGIGFFELVVIAVVALVFVGPKKLPDVMRQAGRFFVQMRRTATDVRGTFDQVIRDAEDEIRKEEAAAMRNLLTGSSPSATKAPPTHTEALDVGHHDGHLHDPHHQTTTHGAGHDAASNAARHASVPAPEGAKPFDPHADTSVAQPKAATKDA